MTHYVIAQLSRQRAGDHRIVDWTLRRMYATAALAGHSARQPHTVTVTQTPEGLQYRMRWRTP